MCTEACVSLLLSRENLCGLPTRRPFSVFSRVERHSADIVVETRVLPIRGRLPLQHALLPNHREILGVPASDGARALITL